MYHGKEREDPTAQRVQGIYRGERRKGGRRPGTLQAKAGHRRTPFRHHKEAMGVRPYNDEKIQDHGIRRRGAYLYRLQPEAHNAHTNGTWPCKTIIGPKKGFCPIKNPIYTRFALSRSVPDHYWTGTDFRASFKIDSMKSLF